MLSLRAHLVPTASPDALARRAAELLRDDAHALGSIARPFSLALTGGSSPARLHHTLTTAPFRDVLDPSRTRLFFGDERAVPPADPASNYGAAERTLLSPLGFPADRVHRMPGESADLDAAARDYASLLAAHTHEGALDVLLLGLGENAHILSLFPGCPDIGSPRGAVVALHDPPMNPPLSRITCTPLVLQRARHVVLIVSGSAKRDALARTLDAPFDPVSVPSHLIRTATGRVSIVCDRDAIGD